MSQTAWVWLTVLTLLFAAAACFAVVFLLTRLREDGHRSDRRLMEQREATLAAVRAMQDAFGGQLGQMRALDEQRMDRMRLNIEARLAAYDQQMQRVATTLDTKLSEIRVTVGEKLDATLDKRLGASFRLVSERLEQVYKGLGEMQSLAEGVGDIKKIFSNVKSRGTWGEVQLGALLEQALAPGQFEANVQIKPGSAERVEYAVRMPGRQDDSPVLLPIDAKFPLEDYRRLAEAMEAGNAPAAEEASRALDLALRREAARIQSKYIDPPRTTDFAILFLPTEGLYAEAMRRAETAERIQRENRILLTGPTNLFALLSSLQMGFRTLAIEKRSSEVWALLGAVKGEFGNFVSILARTQKQIQTVSNTIEEASRKTRTIQRRLSGVQELPERDPPLCLDDAEEEAAAV